MMGLTNLVIVVERMACALEGIDASLATIVEEIQRAYPAEASKAQEVKSSPEVSSEGD